MHFQAKAGFPVYNGDEIKTLQGRVKVPTGGILREPSGRAGETPAATVKVWMKEDLFLCAFDDAEKAVKRFLRMDFLCQEVYKMKKITTKKMTVLAMFIALAVVMTMLVRVPLAPAVSFLTYDPKDIVIGIAGFLFGPLSAALVSVISSAIELLFRGGTIIDWIMNVLSSCSFLCTAAYFYKKVRTKNSAFIGLLVGMAINNIMMLAWNYVMDPIYFGMPQAAVIPMLPWISLFNFLKDSINTVLLLLIYKPVSNALHKSGLVEKRDVSVPSNKKALAIGGGCVLATIVVVVLAAMNLF